MRSAEGEVTKTRSEAAATDVTWEKSPMTVRSASSQSRVGRGDVS